jgi:hypothetical protein
VAHSFAFLRISTMWVPLDKNEGVVKVHESGHVPQAR